MILYRHIMSPIDRSSFQHLANYLSAGSCLKANKIMPHVPWYTHVSYNISIIYIFQQTLISFKVDVSGQLESWYKSTSANVNRFIPQHTH